MIPWRRKWLPIPVFMPGESHGQRNLVGYNPWGCKELDMTGPVFSRGVRRLKWKKPIRNTPRHILIKLTKIKHKEQILKAAREKQQITHKGITIRITVDLSIETLQARREWQGILRVMKENNLQPRLLYPARISFRYEGEFKSFTDKQKLREFSTTKPALQQMLKDLL